MKLEWWGMVLCVVGLVACAAKTTYPAPKQADDGWLTAAPAEVGLDESKLREAVARIQDKTYQDVDSLLIVKDGKLVFEVYFDGYEWDYNSPQFRGKLVRYGQTTPHNLASVTKSVTSILVGIAMDRGAIHGVDDPVFTYFPRYASLSDPQKATITLKHLLTMSSGLQWNEGELPYSDPNNDLVRLFTEPDPIGYILSRPVVSTPGARFYYGGDNTNLLGEAIRTATGQRMDAFAQEVLFGPLGITDYAWDFINSDMIHASGNLRLRPRDMAKLGQLCLNGGVWEGQRIVSETWIAESTQKHVTHSATSGYGYQWWLKTYRMGSTSVDTFYAAGWGGQKIIVAPALDMVVVFTGGNYAANDPSDEIFERYILPAAPASPPASSDTLVLLGTLIDGTGAAPVPDAALVIQGERILAAGPRSEIAIPAHTQVIDLQRATILPGFINAHVHDAYDRDRLAAWAWDGVTTVRDEGILDNSQTLAELLAWRADQAQQPGLARLVSTGYMIGPPGGYGQKLLDKPNALKQAVADELDAGVDLIKFSLEDGYAQRRNLPLFTDEEVAALVTAAHTRGARISVHITDAPFLPTALDAGVDDIAHIQWDPVSDAVIERIAAQGVYVVPTLTVLEAYGSLSSAQSNLRRFVAAGIPIALGNDYTAAPQNAFDHFDLGMPMHEIQRMAEAGMTPMQIIVASTRNAAHVCALENELGTLEAGKRADVLVVDGDPSTDLQALEAVQMVIHNGVIIRDERP